MPEASPPQRPQLAVSAVIFREGKMLLLKRAKSPGHGFWSLPGGRVEFGESLHTALTREVDEEAGLKIDIVALAGWREVLPSCGRQRRSLSHHVVRGALGGGRAAAERGT